jgi:alkylation response protein AidB-like acyl-CoA dehydrogenase
MTYLLPTPDQEELLAAVSEFLDHEAPIERLRPGDPERRRKAEQDLLTQITGLGWHALGLPESAGGSELAVTDEMLFFREAGRRLVSPVLLATVIAAHAALQAGATSLASALVAGTRRCAFAVETTADAQSWESAVVLLDAAPDDLVLVWRPDGMALFTPDQVIDRRAGEGVDETLEMSTGRIAGEPSIWVASNDAGLSLRTSILVTALLSGLAAAVKDMTVEYAKVRQQFGVAIGTFQAVKHPCADMAVRCEAALHQNTFAAICVRDGRSDATFQTAAAKLVATDAAMTNASQSIQLHGGMGYTDECDAGRFLKRALVLRELAGGDRFQRVALMSASGPV